MDRMTSTKFKRMFRLSRASFYSLLEQIKLQIEPSVRGKINSINRNGSYISAEARLAITLPLWWWNAL